MSKKPSDTTPLTTVNSHNLTLLVIYSIVAMIYFTNVAYEYFYIKPETNESIYMNIGLGIMFFILGLSFYMNKKS